MVAKDGAACSVLQPSFCVMTCKSVLDLIRKSNSRFTEIRIFLVLTHQINVIQYFCSTSLCVLTQCPCASQHKHFQKMTFLPQCMHCHQLQHHRFTPSRNPSLSPTAIHTHGCHGRSFSSKLQVSILAMGKSARGGALRVGKAPDSSSFPCWLLQPPGEAITTIPSCAVSKQVLLGFCTQGSTACPSFCFHIRMLMRSLLWGKRSCRTGGPST